MRRPSFRVNEIAAVLLVAAAAIAPFMTENLFIYSILNYFFWRIAGFSVYIMLRMNSLTFATPPPSWRWADTRSRLLVFA